MPYIYSVASADIVINQYGPRVENTPPILKSVLIKGKAKLLINNRGYLDIRPSVETEVSDDDLELLLKDYVFSKAVADGFFSISQKKIKASDAARNLIAGSKSMQLTREKLPKPIIAGEPTEYKVTVGASE